MSSIPSDMASGIVSSMSLSTTEKVRENRLRRMADRQGLALRKSARRDPRAIGYGMYFLIDANRNAVVAGIAGDHPIFTLDDVEAYLTTEPDAPEAR
jgi:hypothetical protein